MEILPIRKVIIANPAGKYKAFERSVKIRFLEPITVSEDLEKSNNELMNIISDELRKAGI